MEATLRFATTDKDREAVYRLRYELYVEGQGLFQDEADHERRWLTDEHDADSPIVLAEIDGELVGTIRITWGPDFDEATRKSYDFERFAGVVDERDILVVTRFVLRPELRGGSLGCEIFKKAFEFAGEHNAELILGTCEIHLVSHYRKLGFRPFGKLYNHRTSGALIPIVAVTGDLDYFRKIDAITLDAVSQRTRPTPNLDEVLAAAIEGSAIASQDQSPNSYRRKVCRLMGEADEATRGILAGLTSEESDTLLAKSHVLTARQGDALILTGHVSRTLYVLLSGSLEIHDGGRKVATVEEPGAVVGEVAMLTPNARMSDVMAGANGAQVLALSYGNLRRIIAGHSALAAKILRFMALGLCDKLVERSVSRQSANDNVVEVEATVAQTAA